MIVARVLHRANRRPNEAVAVLGVVGKGGQTGRRPGCNVDIGACNRLSESSINSFYDRFDVMEIALRKDGCEAVAPQIVSFARAGIISLTTCPVAKMNLSE